MGDFDLHELAPADREDAALAVGEEALARVLNVEDLARLAEGDLLLDLLGALAGAHVQTTPIGSRRVDPELAPDSAVLELGYRKGSLAGDSPRGPEK